jgi:hypothetical protein
VQSLFGESGKHRNAMHERIGSEIGAAELGALRSLRIFIGVAARGRVCDRDIDMGDVVETNQFAQFERGIDRGVAESPARIRFQLVAALGEIVASAEIGERLERPIFARSFRSNRRGPRARTDLR